MTAAVVERLAHARRTRTEASAMGAPTQLAEAYPIQAGVAKLLGETVGGWKVGHDPQSKTPMGAPMYASGFIASGGEFRLAPGRPMIPEVEIAARLSRDLPKRPGKPYTREDVLDSIAELLLAFELIERRIPAKDAPFGFNLADDLGNIGFVTGPAVKNHRDFDISKLRCQFRMGDELANDRVGGHPKGDPLVPLIDWANGQCDELGGMKAGQIITLGSLTPMKAIITPMKLVAELERFGGASVDAV